MRLGIIFAMEEELKAFKDFIEIEKEYEIFDLKFYEGSFKNITCILVESGVGKVNASRATQILIDNMQVDFIFNIGVAGGVSNDLDVLDIDYVVDPKIVRGLDYYCHTVFEIEATVKDFNDSSAEPCCLGRPK